MNLFPDIPPKLFTLSAVAVGYILIDDLTSNEQNAIGNWLMLTAQVLCTNAYFQQLEDEKVTKNQNQYTDQEVLMMLKKMVDALNQEIKEIKKKL